VVQIGFKQWFNIMKDCIKCGLLVRENGGMDWVGKDGVFVRHKVVPHPSFDGIGQTDNAHVSGRSVAWIDGEEVGWNGTRRPVFHGPYP